MPSFSSKSSINNYDLAQELTNSLVAYSPPSSLPSPLKEQATSSISVDNKEQTLEKIDELMEQIQDNCSNVEEQINRAFDCFIVEINSRRKALIDQAQSLRDNKICALLKAKERCWRSKRSLSRKSSCSENSEASSSRSSYRSRRGSVDVHDDILQHNGILEPWRGGDDAIFDTFVSDELATSDSKRYDTLVNRETDNDSRLSSRSSSQDSGVSEVFYEMLEEGNLVFNHTNELSQLLTKFGKIEEKLSSPQLSYVQGFGKEHAIVGEESFFDFIARNKFDERSACDSDFVDVKIFDSNEGEVQSYVFKNQQSYDMSRSPSMNSKKKTSADQATHTISFTPAQQGLHSIQVYLNGVQIADSPFSCYVYTKSTLTFDIPSEKMKNSLSERRESLDDDWVVQKGEKISLLQSSSNGTPSIIFAATEVTGLSAWKVRVTSACSSIVLRVGVGTRCGIPDIDETVSAEFDISSHKSGVDKKFGRKSSTFIRMSYTYVVFLNTADKVLHVYEEESCTAKRVELKTVPYNFFPYCGMVHDHKCAKLVCPRPVITFL